MARLTPVSARTMDRLLKGLGFARVRQRGSHVFYRHPDGRTTSVPHRKGRDLSVPLIRAILADVSFRPKNFCTGSSPDGLAWDEAGSPQARDPVGIESALDRDELQVFEHRLSDQHAVERVAQWPGEAARALAVLDRQGQRLEALAGNTAGDISCDVERVGQLANASRGGDLPRR